MTLTTRQVLTIAERVMAGVVLLALVLLAVRSYTRVEWRWDAWSYHFPYAAKAGGLHVPFHMDEQLAARFSGYPPLAHIIEGALWRVTGTIHAAGVINMIGLVAFLAVCHFLLRAPFFIVGLIALTTPLVVIHSATVYVDLFSNAFLAIGLAVLIYVYVSDRQHDRRLLFVGLGGVVVAMWSKLPLVPIGVLVAGAYVLVYRPWSVDRAARQWLLRAFSGFAVVASLPFVRNLLLHGNPIWPVNAPFFGGDRVPIGGQVVGTIQVPPPLVGRSQPELFIRSLLEIGHPTHYADRPRWVLDQSGGQIAYRSGGFWNVGVVVFFTTMIVLLVVLGGRKGRITAAACGVALGLVSVLPQSHSLRYYMFIPLVWAAVIGMFFPRLRHNHATVALIGCVVAMGMFVTMYRANEQYYRVEHTSYHDAALHWGAVQMWPYLRPGIVYCDIRDQLAFPRGIAMTGPTMKEFTIYVRPTRSACPKGSVPIVNRVVQNDRKL